MIDTYLELCEHPTAEARALIVIWGATFPCESSMMEGMLQAIGGATTARCACFQASADEPRRPAHAQPRIMTPGRHRELVQRVYRP
jgi:hypothetical protein